MNIKQYVNSSMNKILAKKHHFHFSKHNAIKIRRTVHSFFDNAEMFEVQGQKYFSINRSESFSEHTNDQLLQWEWDNNEIYLEKEIIKRNYKESLTFAMKEIEELLASRFCEDSFLIIASLQMGKMRNITIRIMLNRKNNIIDYNLENYNQPLLYEFVYF